MSFHQDSDCQHSGRDLPGSRFVQSLRPCTTGLNRRFRYGRPLNLTHSAEGKIRRPERRDDWFSSYLEGRTQCVSASTGRSELVELTCGVPHGSVLGLIKFIAYTEDLHTAINKFPPPLFRRRHPAACEGRGKLRQLSSSMSGELRNRYPRLVRPSKATTESRKKPS